MTRRIRLTLAYDLMADDAAVRTVTTSLLCDPRMAEADALAYGAEEIRAQVRRDLPRGRLPWGPTVDGQLKRAKAITVRFNEDATVQAMKAEYAFKQHMKTIRQILRYLGGH